MAFAPERQLQGVLDRFPDAVASPKPAGRTATPGDGGGCRRFRAKVVVERKGAEDERGRAAKLPRNGLDRRAGNVAVLFLDLVKGRQDVTLARLKLGHQ